MVRIAMIGRQPGRKFGGGAVQNFELARSLVEIGYEVTNIPGLEGKARIIRYVYRLRNNFDIVHIHSFQPQPIIAAVIGSRIYGTRPIVTFHSFAPPGWYHDMALRNVMRLSLRNCSAVICVSDYVKRRVARFVRADPPRLVTIYNGVDTLLFDPELDATSLKEKLGIADKTVILFVGRLVSLKGVEYLIRAMPRIRKNIDNALLIICGTGAQRNLLEETTRKLELTNSVIFAGFVPHSRLPVYFAASDFCVVPSTFEAMGSVLLEAMSMKKPVIASRVGGIPEIIGDEENGLLVPPRDPEAISDAVLRLYSDRQLYQSLAGNGRRDAVDKYAWNKIATQVSQLYSDLLAS
jgi:glycosyltransferase involved in cell wall biosynthesis